MELDLNTFGFMFECLCYRDLRIYPQALGGRLSYYHDRFGLEADAVLHLDDGRYALIEYKLGSTISSKLDGTALDLHYLCQIIYSETIC